MGNEVYANNMEVSCKAAQGKSICAFPDTCFTPPQTPATPPGVPIPYPNTGMASDTTDGSKTVQVSGQEVMLKNKSYFKRSTGDEAGCAPKKGLITSTNMGKVYFNAWSMDVKFEGENVVRNLDLTTHNHNPSPGNTATWPYLDAAAMSDPDHPCVEDQVNEMLACKEYEPYAKPGKSPCPGSLANAPGQLEGDAVKAHADITSKDAAEDECVKARKCQLSPYNVKPRDGIHACCPGQTPHHVIPKSSFFVTSVKAKTKLPGAEDYNPNKAPCICLEGTNNTMGTHGDAHLAHRSAGEKAGFEEGGLYPFDQQAVVCSDAIKEVAPHCNPDCIEHQVKEGHKRAGVEGNPDIKHSPSGKTAADAAETAKVDGNLATINAP
jgi:hypothetical protein